MSTFLIPLIYKAFTNQELSNLDVDKKHRQTYTYLWAFLKDHWKCLLLQPHGFQKSLHQNKHVKSVYVFIWNAERWRQRRRDLPLADSLLRCLWRQNWSRPQPGTRKSIWVFSVGGRPWDVASWLRTCASAGNGKKQWHLPASKRFGMWYRRFNSNTSSSCQLSVYLLTPFFHELFQVQSYKE